MPKFGTSTWRITSVVLRYGLAVLSVATALMIKELLRNYFDPTPNSLFFCAVVLSSWVGGLGPGLLASALSVVLIDYHFESPYYTLELGAEDLPRMAVFFLSAASISWLSASQKRARESLRRARDELELKVQERTAQFQRINEELRAEIAERKNAEVALLSREAQLKEAQAIAHLGSYEVDVRTGQTRWSDEVFRILGRDPANGSLSRRDFLERVVHPEDREYAEQRYKEVVHDGKLYDLECRVIRPDGCARFVQSLGEAIKSPDGTVIRLVGALLDITERKQTEDNLAQLNRTLQTLYQCNQALVHATDEYELLHAACRILVEVGGLRMAWVSYRELDREKSIRPVAQAGYDEGYVESVKATWKDTERGHGPTGTAIRTGKPSWTKNIQTDSSIAPWRAEALKRGYGSNISLPLRSDGTTFGALTLYAKEPNAFNERTLEQFTELANNLAYGVIALRTRAQRRQAEAALRDAQTELAHVTRILTMGELTASIAHEINQPLAAVVANANACLRWLASPSPNLDEARQAVGRIVRDGNRASDVIGRIRALFKKGGDEKTLLDMNEVIQEVMGLIQSEIQKTGVTLRMVLAANLPRVLGDRVQLQQVILNLVMNGIEAMSAVTDRPRDLLIRSDPYESDKALIAVQDSGIGLNSESLDQLFAAFFTTKPKGMGMGLAISRSIIENHGGKLWAMPNDGPGATFQFTLLKYN
jgi:PAS domain S-box-containing protein